MAQELPDRLKLYQYNIDRLLGRGGSGTVYRGLDPATGHVYALKLFNASFFSSKGQIRDLIRNVKVFREFNHPNVVTVYEVIDGPEGCCLVMEYVDGPDLRWYLENREWNLQERLVISAQMCNGLQYVHDKNFTHHDLKPANILFTRKGMVKLSDYSLVQSRLFSILDSKGITDQVTPMYVSPELIRKEKATPKSDIYSLGITMYYMFTEQLPFMVDTLQRLYNCHLRVMPEHPSNVNRKCPRALGDIIMKMIQKDPAKRFYSCDELRIKLAEIGKSRI
jgi:eukaryotic-like serine/threonine-protein kinase